MTLPEPSAGNRRGDGAPALANMTAVTLLLLGLVGQHKQSSEFWQGRHARETWDV